VAARPWRCRTIVGPANNQLDADSTAELLHTRGIIWAPDTIVSASGIVAATARELQHLSNTLDFRAYAAMSAQARRGMLISVGVAG